MTKKDYQAIARVIHKALFDIDNGATCPRTMVRCIQNGLLDLFAEDNPRFDRERFIEACETGRYRGMRSAA